MRNYQCRGKSLLAVCRLCDSRIYLHTTDQSQRIKQLQCIIIRNYQGLDMGMLFIDISGSCLNARKKSLK